MTCQCRSVCNAMYNGDDDDVDDDNDDDDRATTASATRDRPSALNTSVVVVVTPTIFETDSCATARCATRAVAAISKRVMCVSDSPTAVIKCARDDGCCVTSARNAKQSTPTSTQVLHVEDKDIGSEGVDGGEGAGGTGSPGEWEDTVCCHHAEVLKVTPMCSRSRDDG
jgi:hypothetical protein